MLKLARENMEEVSIQFVVIWNQWGAPRQGKSCSGTSNTFIHMMRFGNNRCTLCAHVCSLFEIATEKRVTVLVVRFMRACLLFPACFCKSTMSASALHLPRSKLPQRHVSIYPVLRGCNDLRKEIFAQKNARSGQRLDLSRLETPAIPVLRWWR